MFGTVYMVYLAVTLIWRLGEFVLVRQIKSMPFLIRTKLLYTMHQSYGIIQVFKDKPAEGTSLL